MKRVTKRNLIKNLREASDFYRREGDLSSNPILRVESKYKARLLEAAANEISSLRQALETYIRIQTS